MSTATITFYKSTKINPSRNMKIDSLESYLLPCKVFEKTKVQYQRTNPLEFNVKLDLSQIYTDFAPSYDIDYAKVQNTNSNRVLYYFITKRSWKSESTVEFHFVLDTINSFSISGTIGDTADYIISKRTNVLREHKDRFASPSTATKISTSLYNPSWELRDGEHIAWFNQSTSIDPTYISNEVDIDNIEIAITAALDGNNALIVPVPSNWEVSCSFVDYNGNPIEHGYGWIQVRIGNVTAAQYLSGVNRIVIRITLNVKVKRIIDFQSEGLSPVLYKSEIGELREECDVTWNLLYKTAKELSEEENNPVDCYLIPNQTFFGTYEPSTTPSTITATDLTVAKIYLFSYRDRRITIPNTMGSTSDPAIELVTDDGVQLLPLWANLPSGVYSQRVIGLVQNGANINWYVLDFAITRDISAPLGWRKTLLNIRTMSKGTCSSISVSGGIDKLYCYEEDYSGDLTDLDTLGYDAPNFYFDLGNTGTSIGLSTLEEYNRTDSKLIKIIEIPYCPAEYDFDSSNGEITIHGMWGLSTLDSKKTYKLGNFNASMTRVVTSELDNPIYNIAYINISPTKILRNDIYESKLYHSDFYQIKFVYDSFGYVFELEKMNFEKSNITGKFSFTFVMTTTINSRFLFMFNDYVMYNMTEDYDMICAVQRNNEKTIYNSTYLTYIRNGYNYDIKARERTIAASSVGLGASIVGGVVGIALGIASQNPAIIVSSVVAATSGVVASAVSTANTIASTEAALNQKMQQLKNQATNVSGSDDIDLLNAYSNNRAKLVEYHVSDRMKKALADLFYYTGYVCNEQKVPSFTSRTYFNFIQMEVDIIEDNAGLSDEIANDLAMRWKNGVTIYHKVNNEWDIEQKYENWEVSLNG